MAQRGAPSSSSVPEGRRDPSTHQLRLFLVLAEELHFGRAAERAFMTQPALSRQIAALEANLGLQLVERTSRAVELTAAGRALLPRVRSAVAAMAELRQAAGRQAREISGHLVIGFIGGEAAMPYTHAILTELRSAHRHLTVEMRTLGLTEQIGALTRGEVDAAFLRPPVPPGIRTLRLAVEPRVACLPADDPLVARQPLLLSQLADHAMVDVPPEIPREWWDFWTVDPRPDGTRVRYGPVAADVEAMLLAVARGEAVVFLPAAARHLFPRPGVAYVDVTDLLPCTAALAWLPRASSRPAVAALCQAARRVVARGDTAAPS